MYTALILVLLGLAAFLFITGSQKHKKVRIAAGIILAASTLLFFWFMDFWGDALWFQALGYGQRYWTVIFYNTGFAAAGALIGWGLLHLLTLYIPKQNPIAKYGSRFIGAFAGGVWGVSNWSVILKFFHGVSTDLHDPILGKSTGFYMFTLPFLDQISSLLFMLTFIALAAAVFYTFFYLSERGLELKPPTGTEDTRALYLSSAVFVFILAFGKYLARYHLMYSTTGVAAGPGWTDVHVLLPAYDIVVVIMVILGIVLMVKPLRKKYQYLFVKLHVNPERSHPLVLGTAAGFIFVLWFLAFSAIPGLFEWLMVQPNEITYERPYITNNIRFTRYGFGLDKIESKQFPVTGKITQETVNNNPSIFSNIRLWDWRALDAVYRQFQEFRLYYQFSDVDVDRYKFDGQYRQVMVSGREMNINSLPTQSQTFVNKRFQYTHGYGITMSTVNEFTQQGLPHMLIKDIPPKSEYPSLKVDRPEIYYGELTTTPVIVNSKEKEFNYPSGQDNVYTRYSGKGGVRISNFWRKFLFGWKFDGTKFLFSNYPTDSSRIMFHREIRERVQELAPFLHFDKDAYIVLAGGKLYWMIDAYTTSDYFPYSQPFNAVVGNLDRLNYIRNSVKAVVNAFDGSVNFYVMDDHDPIIKVWESIFPELFKSKDQMPKDLLSHIRYPIDLLLTQGLVYQKYHMNDPGVFYNQEDLWVRATEKYYNRVQPVEPYYIMWQLPGSDKPQFSLILPFTPKNRQVMIGWIAGICDPPNYGRILAYQFPKDKMILGPQQVETKIDQDSFLSGQLSLWDQRGSNVIRGNVLAIPVNKTVFYVEPIYLQAETAAYPELRLVVVMHGDNLSYGKSFDEALAGLFAQETGKQAVQSFAQLPAKPGVINEISTIKTKIQQANDAFNNYLKLSGQKKFSEAAKQLEKLQQMLDQLSEQNASKK